MFEYATEKLQDARTALERVRSMVIPPNESNIKFVSGPEGVCGDIVGIIDQGAFSEAFSSCIIQIRAVGEAVLNVDELEFNGIKVKEKELKEKNQYKHFRNWKEEKIKNHKALNEGELINFIKEKRIADFHYGVSTLAFTMYGHNFSTNDLGRKPSPDATWIINGKGIFWIINKGTPEERLIPCEINEGCTFAVAIINPPTLYLHKPLPSTDPISICITALKYYEELLFEAKNKFGE